jgi:hypothetical protein
MILENLRYMREHFERHEMQEALELVDKTTSRYEKLCDDICAASAIDGNERVVDLIEEEMEE